MRRDYFTEEMKLKILSPVVVGETTTNNHHHIQCKLCPNIFVATPKSKKQNFGKWNSPGCPKCTKAAFNDREKNRVLKELSEAGFEVLGQYGGNRVNLLVRNLNCCGRTFEAKSNNILSGGTTCPPCNNEAKAKKMRQYNFDRHEEALKYKEGLDKYSHRVRVLTEASYREHKATINPDNLPRGRNVDYHLDHIESISVCFHAGISPKDCAHRSNLQMLPYADNISKGGSNRK